MWIFNESILSLKLDRLQEVTDLNLLDRFEQITINCIYQAAAFWNLKSIIFCIGHWNQFVWSINFGSGMKSKESGKGIFTSYNVWTVRCAVGQNTNTNVYKYTLGSVFEQCFFLQNTKTNTSCVRLFDYWVVVLDRRQNMCCRGSRQAVLSDIPVAYSDTLHWHIVVHCGILHWHIVVHCDTFTLTHWSQRWILWTLCYFLGCFSSAVLDSDW